MRTSGFARASSQPSSRRSGGVGYFDAQFSAAGGRSAHVERLLFERNGEKTGRPMKVLVTGAAGYIGSHAIRRVHSAGHDVVALDNLSRGHREALPAGVPFVECDVADRERVRAALVE